MFDCDYTREAIMRMRREELERDMDRRARHNWYPPNSSHKKTRDSGKLSLLMVFFRNVIMK